MADDNITKIGMEFVDEENENEGKKADVPAVVEEKPGLGKRIWNGITAPGRWVVKTVKDSPAAAAIGSVGTAVLIVAGKVVKDRFFGHGGKNDFIPADPIEVPDDGEVYADSTYGESEE